MLVLPGEFTYLIGNDKITRDLGLDAFYNTRHLLRNLSDKNLTFALYKPGNVLNHTSYRSNKWILAVKANEQVTISDSEIARYLGISNKKIQGVKKFEIVPDLSPCYELIRGPPGEPGPPGPPGKKRVIKPLPGIRGSNAKLRRI